jgi:hypothetical protein
MVRNGQSGNLWRHRYPDTFWKSLKIRQATGTA